MKVAEPKLPNTTDQTRAFGIAVSVRDTGNLRVLANGLRRETAPQCHKPLVRTNHIIP
jgi:hypothetical protein